MLSIIVMDISIIIPTYKPKDYLWECLDSLVAQTLSKERFEIILVLNGCCEPWNSSIEDYIVREKGNLNIHFIQTDTPGVSNARNIGINESKGENIFFLDDDDFLSPVCLEELIGLQNGDAVIECYPFAFEDGDKTITQQKYGLTNVYDYCTAHGCKQLNSTARKFFSGPCMKLIPSTYIGERRFDTRFKNGEDSLFMFSISDRINIIEYTSNNAIYYRRYRKGSATTSSRSKKEHIKNIIRCMKGYSSFYFKGGYSTYFYISRILAEIKCLVQVILKG